MNITLFYNDCFQSVIISKYEELSLLIEKYFNIPQSYQIIKLNDQLLIKEDLRDGDLLYIFQSYQKSYHHIHILGECNHYKFKMIIDSGSQSNVISNHLAELLNLTIDKRNQGTAKGVGSATIVGSTSLTLQINNKSYTLECSVMLTENDPMTKNLFLIGLPFLMPDCMISFKTQTLTIQDDVVHFMNDYDLGQYIYPIKIKSPIEQLYNNLNLSLDEHILLKKIITNIINNPHEEKYKLINTNNVAYQKHLSKYNEFMKLLGFVEMNKQLKYTNDVGVLSNLIEIM